MRLIRIACLDSVFIFVFSTFSNVINVLYSRTISKIPAAPMPTPIHIVTMP